MHKSPTSTMYPSTSSTPKATPKVANFFHREICRNKNKTTTYAEVFKKKIIFESNNKLPLGCKLLNRSIEKYSSVNRSREGSLEKKYRTNHMEIQSNILNISINSSGSNENEDDYERQTGKLGRSLEKYPDEDFIKVEDFMGTNQDQQTKDKLNQQFQRLLEEIERIKRDEEAEQAKFKTVDKNIKDKKKMVLSEKKPMNQKEGLSSIEHELNKQITKLDQTFRKSKESGDKNSKKLRIELEGLKEKWQNLNEKEIYLLGVRKDEQQKEIEFNKEAVNFQKQKKQEAALLSEFNQAKEDAKKIQSKLNKVKSTELPSIDVHKKYISMLERSFIQKQIQKINLYLTGKKEHAELKRKSSKLKDQITITKIELDQVKKRLEEKNKKMAKLKDEMVEKSRVFIELSHEEEQLNSVRMNK